MASNSPLSHWDAFTRWHTMLMDDTSSFYTERSIEEAFNDEAHRNLVIDGIEMMILGKVPEMVVLDYSAEALGGP